MLLSQRRRTSPCWISWVACSPLNLFKWYALQSLRAFQERAFPKTVLVSETVIDGFQVSDFVSRAKKVQLGSQR